MAKPKGYSKGGKVGSKVSYSDGKTSGTPKSRGAGSFPRVSTGMMRQQMGPKPPGIPGA